MAESPSCSSAAESRGPISILADAPSIRPGLGFDTYVSALVEAIRGGTPAQFTIGVYGPWGSGKSSLLNAIANELAKDAEVIPVQFDAWRYESVSYLVVPMLHAVYGATQALNDDSITAAVRRGLLSVLRGITLSVGPVSINGAAVLNPDSGDAITTLDDAFSRPYAEMRTISETLGGKRIVVLIDDLDRCSPAKLVGLLEAINLVMDVPGFVFVLALDYDALTKAVAAQYPHVSGHVFVEKMVQVPFRVPRLDLRRASFLSELVPDWQSRARSFPAGFGEVVHDVARLGLESNPRQIKRLINSILILLRVATVRQVTVDLGMLAGIVGIQLRWPAEYSDFIDAVLADDADPLVSIMPDDGGSLKRYAEHFFQADVTAAVLRPYLQLTRAVSLSKGLEDQRDAIEADVAGSIVSTRETLKQELVSALSHAGYTRASSSDVYHLDRNPDFRVKLGKTVVRFEMRNDDNRWIGVSHSLAKDGGRALRLASEPRLMVREVFREYHSGRVRPFWAERLQRRNVDLGQLAEPSPNDPS